MTQGKCLVLAQDELKIQTSANAHKKASPLTLKLVEINDNQFQSS